MPKQLDIYRTAIPMRGFEHAAAARHHAESIVVRLQYEDGWVGWGETLPRTYVTGETLDTVPEDIAGVLWEKCLQKKLLSTSDTLAVLPQVHDCRCITAAAAALDVAASRRLCGPDARLNMAMLGRLFPGITMQRKIAARVSGVLGSAKTAKTAKRLKLMWWAGMRDFKLKLGLGEDNDTANLELVHARLAKAMACGKASLRVDVNGGWSADETPERVEALQQYGVCAVEQPVYCTAGQLVELAPKCSLPLMADESLLTLDDAQTLLAEPKRIWWNVRTSKNGGMLPVMHLLHLAAERGVTVSYGCMVGETSILSAAQRRVLQVCPQPRFVEGNYGRLLLKRDITTKSLRFGYAGRLKPLMGTDLGITIDPNKFDAVATHLKTLKV